MSKLNSLYRSSILWMLMDETTFLISNAREKELRKNNLSSVQIKVLLILNYVAHALTVQELCRWTIRGHTSMSLLTDKMVDKGFVEKNIDKNNKNQTLVTITRNGQQIIRKLNTQRPIPEVFSVLSKQESNQLTLYLKKIINQAIKVTSPSYPPNLKELSKMLMKYAT
jgi:MarR family transcriptional regulator, organic hydroperoxide resistance regulator